MAKRKTAMVAPVPSKPKTRPTAMPAPAKSKLPEIRTHPDVLTLEEILHLAGNNRAYTVLGHHGNVWKVHFEGDIVPSLVDLEDGKPVIAQVID